MFTYSGICASHASVAASAEGGGSDGQKAEGGNGRTRNRPPLPRGEKGDGQEQPKLRLDDEASQQEAGGEGSALQEAAFPR